MNFEDGSPVTDWLSIDQIRGLIHQVDIGGHYPSYLKDQVNTQPRRAERIRQHAREWRYALRFSTLKAKIERQLGETASQAMLSFCQGMDNGADLLRIAPWRSFARLALRQAMWRTGCSSSKYRQAAAGSCTAPSMPTGRCRNFRPSNC